MLTEGARRTSVATGKLFEYLDAGRPVLVLGEETEAARIVSETGTGDAVSATDPASIADGLRRFSAGGRAAAPDGDAVARYSWERLAGLYAELIKGTCGG